MGGMPPGALKRHASTMRRICADFHVSSNGRSTKPK
jgi:hypothetical protein